MIRRIYGLVVPLFLLISVLTSVSLYSIDIYVDDFQVFKVDSTKSESEIKKDKENVSNFLKKKLIENSTNFLIYKYISDLSKNIPDDYVILSPLQTTLDLLAVSFFCNIEYILFGKIMIETDKNEYDAFIKVYSKEKNLIIYDIHYSKIITQQDAYLTELVNNINKQLTTILEPERQKEKEEDDDKSQETSIINEEVEVEVEDKNELEDKKKLQVKDDEKENEINKYEYETSEKEEYEKKIFGFFVSVGYYYPLKNEYKDFIIPCTSIEEGIKFEFLIADKKKFDFLLRPGLLFNYSFALNKSDCRYIHYHSLTFKLSLETCFAFLNKFDFFIGTGPQYEFNIIDYQTPTKLFFTDIPYAFGMFINLGFDYFIGKKKNTYIGFTNIIDFTFYNEVSINYKILFHFLFKV